MVETKEQKDCKSPRPEKVLTSYTNEVEETIFEEASLIGNRRKVAVLYELLSACLSDTPDDDKKSERPPKGIPTQITILIFQEAIEVVLSCFEMAVLKQVDGKENEHDDSWDKWKRGGLIGAAAVTGGTLMAITGGLAAPAIASGASALAPTLGRAGCFAAVASATGSIAGSVAVTASFGAAGAGLSGTMMARRTGSVDEFEFKLKMNSHYCGFPLDNNRLAVEILVAGFVFQEEDFFRPWEGQNNNMERYVLQWESKHLISISTAIQDWRTSRIAIELMKQGAMMTVLSSLLTALALPAALLTLTDIINSK